MTEQPDVDRQRGVRVAQLGAVPRVLVWDGEGAIGRWRGGRTELTAECQAFRGTLAAKVLVCRPADPEAKGLVERANGYLETSFLPGRTFIGPTDFNDQLQAWLAIVNTLATVFFLSVGTLISIYLIVINGGDFQISADFSPLDAGLLVATAAVAAIPAVVIYNVFASWIAAYRATLADAAAGVERLVSRDFDHRRLAVIPLTRAAE